MSQMTRYQLDIPIKKLTIKRIDIITLHKSNYTPKDFKLVLKYNRQILFMYFIDTVLTLYHLCLTFKGKRDDDIKFIKRGVDSLSPTGLEFFEKLVQVCCS